jgi:hypothetical protein
MKKRIRVTLKNYRVFTDQRPAVFDIGPGLTAFLGPNNVGKSSIKLFFYEMRPLFAILSAGVNVSPGFYTAVSGETQVKYADVSDPLEIFNNRNSRDASFRIEILDPSPSKHDLVYRIDGYAVRERPTQWKLSFFGLSQPDQPGMLRGKIKAVDNEPHCFRSDGNDSAYDFSDIMDVAIAIKNAVYYGAFRNALNEGGARHYDFAVGTAFIELWNEWKTAGNIAKARAIGRITDEIRKLFGYEHLEINASTALKTLLITADGHPLPLKALGSGISQFIMVLGNAATTRPSLIFIDEPETNLHPALQIDFLLTLAQYAGAGCVFSTHSVGLARSVAPNIFSIQRTFDGPIVRPFAATTSYSEFLGELSFSTFKELGCERILLVEGVHDVKVMQQLLRLKQKEHSVVILPLGGDQLVAGDREQELGELKRLSDKISVLVDSERPSFDASPADRRMEFAETCRRLSFDVLLTDRRALENYFPTHAIVSALGSGFTCLAPFERLADHANGWGKSDNWKIARYMTTRDLEGTDLGGFLERL